MKQFTISLLVFIFSFLLLQAPVLAAVNDQDRAAIYDVIDSFEKNINEGNVTSINDLISPNAPASLMEGIWNNFGSTGIEGFKLEDIENVNNFDSNYNYYTQEITNIEELSATKVRASGRFAATGLGWSISGITSYFILEKIDTQWYILDTDIHTRANTDYVFSTIFSIFKYIIPIFLILLAFWAWMLIDVIMRDMPDKTKWVLMVVLLSWVGALIYFFTARRRSKRRHAPTSHHNSHIEYT